MPRKTCAAVVRRRGCKGFNEAAARCRGKPTRRPTRGAAARWASMRPRPDAAENAVATAAQKHVDAASMRPRPDAAENTVSGLPLPGAVLGLQ